MPMNIPPHVRDYVRAVFWDVNRQVSEIYGANPTTHEESLDGALIHGLARHSAPVAVDSNWIVRIDVHYLGGGRHWDRWEVADLGLLVMLRQAGAVSAVKTAVLQSKRLYPDEQRDPDELDALDYRFGFSRLFTGNAAIERIIEPRVFSFTHDSKYRALVVGDDQWNAIEQYGQTAMPVHYLLHHPPGVPMATTLPRVGPPEPVPVAVGAQVQRAADLHRSAAPLGKGATPTFARLQMNTKWSLEGFVADEVLVCREGTEVREGNVDLERLFFRRSGPISAAIAVTIDQVRAP